MPGKQITMESVSDPAADLAMFSADVKALILALREMKQYRVRVRPLFGEDPKIITSIPVVINGYRFTIPYNVSVMLPEEAYLILVRAGRIDPQEDEHEHEVPVKWEPPKNFDPRTLAAA